MDLTYRNASEALPHLAREVLKDPADINSRAGRVKELLYPQVTLTQPWQREILTRKVNVAAQIAETMWVLSGRNDIGWLSHYLPRAKDFSDDGSTWRAGYGPRLRRWHLKESNGAYYTDQLKAVYSKLKADPTTRQAVISLWDPTLDQTTNTKDIPCNNWLHFLNRQGALDLHVVIRSNDLIWGWSGINAFEWSALQEILASMLGISVGKLVFSISSLHIYEKHWPRAEKIAGTNKELGMTYADSPRFEGGSWAEFQTLLNDWFRVEELVRTHASGASAAVEAFPDPMFRSWLRVIQYYWSAGTNGDLSYLEKIHGTRLDAAARNIPQSLLPEISVKPEAPIPSFQKFLLDLHEEKDKAYGDSWVKRGEMLGIMANLARKVDRLGVSGGGDTAADTAIDLLCYLLKYKVWLFTETRTGEDHRAMVAEELIELSRIRREATPVKVLEKKLTDEFTQLERDVTEKTGRRMGSIDRMLPDALELAQQLWWRENNDKRSWKGYGDE